MHSKLWRKFLKNLMLFIKDIINKVTTAAVEAFQSDSVKLKHWKIVETKRSLLKLLFILPNQIFLIAEYSWSSLVSY